MKVISIIVDEFPENCEKCWLVKKDTSLDIYRCAGLSREVNYLYNKPFGMKYRRSDCPMIESSISILLKEMNHNDEK